jgi:signal transduction histidine kinase
MAERLNEEKQKVLDQIRSLEEKNLQLQQAQQEIIQSEKLASVGRLAAGVAHEIGNPIGIILGYIQLLLTHQLDEQEKTDCLQRMNAETERVSEIIRNLLDYAQPSAEHTEALDLNRIIEETHALVSYQKKYQNIAVTFELDRRIPPVTGDEKLLRQILINLTLNALDAMPQGGALGYKTSEEQVSGKTCVSFTLTDSGTGITPDNIGKIFDPFFTTKEPGKGTGLGLSNVQRIVDAMGGKIRLTSTPGQGTAFTVLFPVIKT